MHSKIFCVKMMHSNVLQSQILNFNVMHSKMLQSKIFYLKMLHLKVLHSKVLQSHKLQSKMLQSNERCAYSVSDRVETLGSKNSEKISEISTSGSFLWKIENFWNNRSRRIESQNILNNSELEFIIEICKYLKVNDRIKF